MKKGGCFWSALHLQDLKCMRFIPAPKRNVTAGWGIFKMQWKGREKGFWFSPWQSKADRRSFGYLLQRALSSALHWISGSILWGWVHKHQNLTITSAKLPVFFCFTTEPTDLSCSPSDVLTCHFRLLSPFLLALDAFLSSASVHTSILDKSPITPWY